MYEHQCALGFRFRQSFTEKGTDYLIDLFQPAAQAKILYNYTDFHPQHF